MSCLQAYRAEINSFISYLLCDENNLVNNWSHMNSMKLSNLNKVQKKEIPYHKLNCYEKSIITFHSGCIYFR